ncbi:hypothetical protein [Ferruginibacter sp. HRS2-29]|uniref:hypothetical protein n=1 Tax=Ferruginibacter sp. HRS2-29 TaxID=2487334 RepID=UPI0020CBAE40|nr:hypothetical protein [Ferruginibacter sp. HRS2-29]MCP9750495.1 hypothetical protein [Ferruginibacter sp. HRS2-29]
MKYLSFVCIAAVIVFSCSPKTTPTSTAGTTTTTSTTTTTAPVVVEETKTVTTVTTTTIADPKNSTEALAGAKTYEAKCGRCHGLKKVDDFTAQEWVPIMNSMAPKARLDSTEKAHVLLYVQSNAKKG